jgi:NADPH-dependent 2,4-dienoyl-CoA reductase/sulfur reductase-like enzyme
LKEAELAIVGAGPGGIAAAMEAAKLGVTPTLIDDNTKIGGQIYRQFNKGLNITDPELMGPDFERGSKLLKGFDEYKGQLDYLNEAVVWGLFDGNELAYQRGKESFGMKYRRLIVSTGAYDRPVPFPGWTLPGILTAGGAQNLVKLQGVIPGNNILLAGTGPLQLTLASQIIRAGGKIEAILEAGNIDRWLSLVWGSLGQWELLSDGWQYWRDIRKAGVPLMRRHMITEAQGNGKVEEAVIAEIDKDWRPTSANRQTLKVDTICLEYGFVPSVELTRLAKCEHRYEPLLGGWIPLRKNNMETSVPGIYCVGDGSGVAGSFVAIEEGRIAGVSVALSLGYVSAGNAVKYMKPFRKRLNRMNRLRKALDVISMPRAGLYELASDNTIICRCMEITLKEIKEAILKGAADINEVKRVTHAGMGRCQGRMCGPVAFEIISRYLEPGSIQSNYLTARPPVKPISIAALAQHKL